MPTQLDANDAVQPAAISNSLSRRKILSGAAAMAATSLIAPDALARNFNRGAEPQRYPDPDIVVIDANRFKARVGNTVIKRLYTGCLWAEGPAWNAQGQYLIWSDIPANRQLRYLDDDGHISERFRYPSEESNGNSFDTEGRQLSAQRTRLVRFEHNGSVTTLAEQANGKPLNGPNDMVVNPIDKAIWFTDPGYGAINLYEGQRAAAGVTQPHQKEAYRIDPTNGQISKVADDPFKPNGLAFSPDYKKLYVCDTGITHYPNAKNVVWQYDVDGGKLSNAKPLIDMTLDASPASLTGCASIPKAISGSAPDGSARAMTACRSSRRTASASARSSFRRPARTCVSAARSATGCS